MERRGREDANSGGEARMRRRVPGSSVRSSPATRPGRFTRLSRESRGTPGILTIATPSSNALSNNRARNPTKNRQTPPTERLSLRLSNKTRRSIYPATKKRRRTCAIGRKSRMDFTVRENATHLPTMIAILCIQVIRKWIGQLCRLYLLARSLSLEVT